MSRFDLFVVLADMRTGSNFLEANLNALDGVALPRRGRSTRSSWASPTAPTCSASRSRGARPTPAS